MRELLAENSKLRKELGRSKNEGRNHTKSDRILRQGVVSKYAVMNMLRLQHHVKILARTLSVSRSGSAIEYGDIRALEASLRLTELATTTLQDNRHKTIAVSLLEFTGQSNTSQAFL